MNLERGALTNILDRFRGRTLNSLDHPAVRTFHLPGGCRAHDGKEQHVVLEPYASNGRMAAFPTPSFPAAYGLIQKAGFQLLGVDFYFDVDQVDGRRLPDWRAYHRTNHHELAEC